MTKNIDSNVNTDNITTEIEPKLLNMEVKVLVKNLAGWDVGFSKKDGTFAGDITIPANGSIRLARSEILSQVQYNNKLLAGTDGFGSHATIYIDDRDTRIEVGFESEDGKTKQKILSEDKVKEMFELKTLSTFKKHLEDAVVTRAEKYAFIGFVKKLKLNDYDKIKAAEEHCKFTLDKID